MRHSIIRDGDLVSDLNVSKKKQSKLIYILNDLKVKSESHFSILTSHQQRMIYTKFLF
jgi:hypothetical protein